MKLRELTATIAAVGLAGAILAAAPNAGAQDAKAEAPKDKASDYGVNPTEGERRASGDPMLLGQFVFGQRCKVCHARTENGLTTYGPHLQGIVGRKAAATDYGEHSDALKASDVVWDEKTLDAVLRDPNKVMPGSKMSTVVRFKRSRKALIMYLKTL